MDEKKHNSKITHFLIKKSTRIIVAVRNGLNNSFSRIQNEKLKQNILQAIPFWFAAIVTSLVAILYAKTFAMAEHLTTIIFNYHAWLLFLLTPLCFISSWWLVKKFAPYSKGSGIPQVMASVELATPKHNDKIYKLLSFRIIIVKFVSSIIMVIGGGAIGREGPTIQISGSIFRIINESLPSWWPRISKKNMIVTGAAAGLAAAFNTPLGGIVFAVEELTKMHFSNFKAAIFTAVIIAGLVVQGLLGSYLYLGFPMVNDVRYSMLLGVLLVAVIAGILGSGMSKILWIILKWKTSFQHNKQHIFYLLFCSLAVASIAYFVNATVLGSGKDILMTTLFSSEKYVHWTTPILRFFGPILSFTTGSSGGVFAPGLSAGGSIGSVVSSWFQLSASYTNLMILAGMVAFLTGITRAPFTSAILVLEMTDRNNLILHLMLAALIANFVSILVDKHSLYDRLKHQYLDEIVNEEIVQTELNTEKKA